MLIRRPGVFPRANYYSESVSSRPGSPKGVIQRLGSVSGVGLAPRASKQFWAILLRAIARTIAQKCCFATPTPSHRLYSAPNRSHHVPVAPREVCSAFGWCHGLAWHPERRSKFCPILLENWTISKIDDLPPRGLPFGNTPHRNDVITSLNSQGTTRALRVGIGGWLGPFLRGS